jgi:hypothetical protein
MLAQMSGYHGGLGDVVSQLSVPHSQPPPHLGDGSSRSPASGLQFGQGQLRPPAYDWKLHFGEGQSKPPASGIDWELQFGQGQSRPPASGVDWDIRPIVYEKEVMVLRPTFAKARPCS